MNRIADVVVVGAGPAGAAAALGLTRLGKHVTVIGTARGDTIEGISARTKARLAAAGLHHAAGIAVSATPRHAHWAGSSAARGEEFLIRRERFDAALAEDLLEAGIRVQPLAAKSLTPAGGIWQVETDQGSLRGRSLIDARGRRARRAEARGPVLMAMAEMRELDHACPPGSAVVALDQGWCWMARTDRCLLIQFIGASDAGTLRAGLTAHAIAAAEEIRDSQPEWREILARARPRGADRLTGRGAVAQFSRPAQAAGALRIGDAAVAVDPLSGHGIFEALGSAHVAIAAVNTYLEGADWAPIARFVNERAAEGWRRSLATAGDFYRLHAPHASTTFWPATAASYEALAAAAGPRDNGPARFESRPVLNGDRIELRPVWVSPDWPRGIWRMNGRELHTARGADPDYS